MWTNHLKIAWRHLQKKSLLSALKIIGLGVGIAASLLLTKYVSWQWNFDRFHSHGQEIVRIENDHLMNGVLQSKSAMTYAGVPVIAKETFPEVVDYLRLGRWIANDVEFRHEENLFRGKNCFFTDPAFFDVFSFEMIMGDPETALIEPNSLVLTLSTAQKLFGSANPIGEEVLFENLKTFKITGVVNNPPIQSHIQFDMLGSLSTMNNWGLNVYADDQLNATYVYAYLHLQKNADLVELEKAITNKVSTLKSKEQGADVFKLQPLREIHLYSDLDNEIQTTGQGNNIWILTSIAILILLLAWVNHFNLYSATVLDQTQALSVRRIVGASKKQLFQQIAFSAFFFSFLGLVAGIAILLIAEPFIERIFNLPLENLSFRQVSFTDPSIYLLLLVALGVVINTILPALSLSNISGVSLLAKKFPRQDHGLNFRKVLVIFQFTIIISLIAATSIIYQQTRFMEDEDLGMALDDVIAIRGPLGAGYEDVKLNFPKFKQDILAMPEILTMSSSHDVPGNQLELTENITFDQKDYSFGFYRNYGDLDYFRSYKIPFIARDTSISLVAKDTRYCVINKMAAEVLGFKSPDEALRKSIGLWGSDRHIIGVVDNYYQRSLHFPLTPIIFDISSDGLMTDGYYTMKLASGGNIEKTIANIKTAYSEAFPYTVFLPLIVSDHFAAQYQDDNNFKKLNLGFTILGLLIAFLGLLGLMIITVEKRIKELGIRKVLGASVSGLVFLLSKEMIKVTLIAWFIATPLVWYLMNKWLNNFSVRIEISWFVFIWSALLVMLMAFLTTGTHAIKAALVDPAKILRDE